MKVYSCKVTEVRVGSRDPVRCPKCGARRIVRLQLTRHEPKDINPDILQHWPSRSEERCERECGWILDPPRASTVLDWTAAERPPSDGVLEVNGFIKL